MRSPQSDHRKMITEGVWEFNFTIDRSQPPATISLPDTEVMAMNLELREEAPIILKNIELTNTGIQFSVMTTRKALTLWRRTLRLC